MRRHKEAKGRNERKVKGGKGMQREAEGGRGNMRKVDGGKGSERERQRE